MKLQAAKFNLTLNPQLSTTPFHSPLKWGAAPNVNSARQSNEIYYNIFFRFFDIPCMSSGLL